MPQYESIACDRCGCHAFFIVTPAINAEPWDDPPQYIICIFCVQDENELWHSLGKRHRILAVDQLLSETEAAKYWERQEQSRNLTRNLNAIIIGIKESA